MIREKAYPLEFDFVVILTFKGCIFVFGSGAFPVIVLSRKGIRESIMLSGYRVSEKDFPLYRLGSLREITCFDVLYDCFECPPPWKILISDRDISHIIRIIDLPVLFGLNSRNLSRRLIGETKMIDKEDVDLITLCA